MVAPDTLATSVARADAWFETMRQQGGYGGPVVHWWNHSLRFAGAATDWRYEGLLIGYSELAHRFGGRWRDRLEAAVGDVLSSQLPSGHYRASRFEANPGTAGTPHEAAVSRGLLTAAKVLGGMETGIDAARRNLEGLLRKLWNEELGTFVDVPGSAGVVPNKVATMALALMELAEASRDDHHLLRYAQRALRGALTLQVRKGRFVGAIHQYAPGGHHGDGRFFPFYIARCVPAFTRASRIWDDAQFREAAELVVDFLDRTMLSTGTWPQVLYAHGQRRDFPSWVAGVGDILMAFEEVGRTAPPAAIDQLLRSQSSMGGFPTALGFDGMPDNAWPAIADLLPVVGWTDKAFAYLVRILARNRAGPESLPLPRIAPWERTVTLRGVQGEMREDEGSVIARFSGAGHALSWQKSHPWTRCVSESLGAW